MKEPVGEECVGKNAFAGVWACIKKDNEGITSGKFESVAAAISEWLVSPGESQFRAELEELAGQQQSTTFHRKTAGEFREIIAQACHELRMSEVVTFGKISGGHYTMRWDPWTANAGKVDSQQVESDRKTDYDSVAYFTHYHENTFVDLMLFGVQAEAEKQNITIDVQRVDSDTEIFNSIAKDDRPNCLYIVDWSSEAEQQRFTRKLQEQEKTVITTANFGAGVSQRNDEIGERAARYFIEHGLNRESPILVTRPTHKGEPLDYNTPVEVRISNFRVVLEEEFGRKPNIQYLPVPDMRRGGIMSAVANKVLPFLDSKNIAAAFATSGDAGVALALSIPNWQSIPIVSADFTPELVQLLLEQGNNLEALFGLDPFSYGRQKFAGATSGISMEQIRVSSLDRMEVWNRQRQSCSLYELVAVGATRADEKNLDKEADKNVRSIGDVVVVAILGGSASGKTTLARLIKRASYMNEVTVVPVDAFYRDELREQDEPNFDLPNAIDWDRLKKDVTRLKCGRPTRIPTYDFSTHARSVRIVTYPAPILIIEGLHALDEEIAGLSDLKYFVDLDGTVRYQRRLERDQASRGRSEESVRNQWETQVEPSYKKYIEPKKSLDGVVLVNGDGDMAMSANEILERARGKRKV